jgi:formyltetrahydrofolate deformylase
LFFLAQAAQIMQFVITAVGPDHRGLADPIVHSVTELGANIAEIQMFDQDDESVFSMLTRVELPHDLGGELATAMSDVARLTGLSIRTWSPQISGRLPRLAICVTYRPECAAAILQAIAQGHIPAQPAVMIGNRQRCQYLAREFGVDWQHIGDDQGQANDTRLIEICDHHQIDYVILARYMRVLPPSSCWKYAGGRIINLHHGLLPSFPGMRPYHDAHACRMLTFGATCHFIVPELDAGNQIINQSTFSVAPGTSIDDIVARGQSENEPRCLVEGVRRVTAGEVQLHFNRVVATHR